MGFYDDMQGIATDLLKQFSQGTILLKQQTRTVDPDYPDRVASSSDVVYRLNATAQSVAKEFIDGETITAKDSMVRCATKATEVSSGAEVDIEPTEGDILTIDGAVRQILGVRRIPEAGTVVAWAIITRGSWQRGTR